MARQSHELRGGKFDGGAIHREPEGDD
jgi:hypothetical protein